MKTKYAIIGGGVAGLSAAIRLAELGEEPLVIESGIYPAHKICGEFLSPECIDHLKKWGIRPVEIFQAVIHTSNCRLASPFPSPAGGLSHLELEPLLVKHAVSCGVKLMTNASIKVFQQKKHTANTCLIHLADNQTVEAKNVIIAAGKFNPSSPPLVTCYKGFKAHFRNINPNSDQIEMFSFSGAYLGVSPVEKGKVNVACIAKINKVQHFDPQAFIQTLISQNSYLNSLLPHQNNLFNKWMVASIPAFGMRCTPLWPDCYFIGDAAMSIPPACGNGLSLAVFGGRLAAEYALKGQYQEFKFMWKKRCSSQLFWAKRLHELMLNPFYSKPVMLLSKTFPLISQKLFRLTRFSI